jgi:hypothetical protein
MNSGEPYAASIGGEATGEQEEKGTAGFRSHGHEQYNPPVLSLWVALICLPRRGTTHGGGEKK